MNADNDVLMKNRLSSYCDHKYWRLMKVDFVQKLSQTELDDMLLVVEEKDYKKGDDIFVKGKELTSDLFIIKEGAIKVTSYLSNGEEIIKGIFKKGEIFGILKLFDVEESEDYITTIDDTHICILDINYFYNLIENNKNLRDYIFRLIGLRIRKLENNVTSLLYKDSTIRIKNFIINYIQDFGEEKGSILCTKNLLSNNEIAKITGTSRQTVNKIMNDLKRTNIIGYDNREMWMKNNFI